MRLFLVDYDQFLLVSFHDDVSYHFEYHLFFLLIMMFLGSWSFQQKKITEKRPSL